MSCPDRNLAFFHHYRHYEGLRLLPSVCDSKLIQQTLFKKRLKEKKNISGKDWEQIECIFNKLYPCFKDKLLKKYNLRNEDFKICILVKLNFTNIDISGIMNRTPSAISMKRANLYQKITKSDGSAKDFNDFIKAI